MFSVVHIRQRFFALSVGLLLVGCSGGRRMVEAGALGPSARLPVSLSGAKLDGTRFDLEQVRGKVVLVHYFATWDPSAAQRMGGFNDLLEGDQAFTADALVVLGICVDRNPKATLQDFIDASQLSVPILVADTHTMKRGHTPFGPLRAVPTTFLIDSMGRLSERIDGHAPLEYARRQVAALAEESR